METLKFHSLQKIGLLPAVALGITLLLHTGTAYAQDPQQRTLEEVKVTARVITTVEEVGPMRVRLNVLNPTEMPVRIAILNYQNQPVFEESFRGPEYNKVLNFNSTIPGRYALRVAGKDHSETRRFRVDSKVKREMSAAALERSQNADVMATIYKASPTKVMLQMVNNTGEPVEYIFRNNDQDLIHQGIVRDEKFAKAFDMSQVEDGKYTVEVKYKTEKAATRAFDMNTVYERSFNWTDKRGKPIKP